jgi:hypothetical protein
LSPLNPPDTFKEYLGARIREWLDENERSVRWLARKAGYNQQAVQDIVDGVRNCKAHTLWRLCKAMRVKMDALVKGYKEGD